MTVFDLRGTAAQNALVQSALDVCDFPFERLLPGITSSTGGRTTIPVEWADLSRFTQARGLAKAWASGGGPDHSHVHTEDGEAHPIERVVDGRRRVLGLAYYPPTLKVVLDLSCESRPHLAREVFLAEGAHMVDFTYLTNAHRVAIVNAVHTEQLPASYEVKDGAALNLDGHTCSWFDVGAYADWVGEAFMEGFIESFAPSVKVTIELNHPVTTWGAQRIRWALVGADLFGTKHGRTYHLPGCPFIRTAWLAHKTTWATPEDALLAGRRPCRVCKPPTSSWQAGTYAGTFSPEGGYGA